MYMYYQLSMSSTTSSTTSETMQYNSFNSCLSNDNRTAYYRLNGRIFAIRIAYDKNNTHHSGWGNRGEMEFISTENGSRKLSVRVRSNKDNIDEPVPIAIMIFMQYDKNYVNDRFAASMKIRNNQIKLASKSSRVVASLVGELGNRSFDEAEIAFSSSSEKHHGCLISTINVNNSDRTLEVGRNEVIDACTGNTDTAYHGDCAQMELGLHISGGRMLPPRQYKIARSSSHWSDESSSSTMWKSNSKKSKSIGRSDEGSYEPRRSGTITKSRSIGRGAPSASDFRVGAGAVQDRRWHTVAFESNLNFKIPFEIIVEPYIPSSVNPY